jgi:gentisate 1,2-dioxygenase
VKSLAPGVSIASTRASDPKAPNSGRLLVYELRAGKVTTIINGERRQRREGDFWIVRSWQNIAIEADDDSAVIQIIEITGL